MQLPVDVQEEGVIKSIQGYKYSDAKLALSYALFVISGGFLYLLTRWDIQVKILLQMVQCTEKEAQFLKVTAGDDAVDLVPIQQEDLTIDSVTRRFLVFSFRLYKYYLDELKGKFVPIEFNIFNLTNNQIHERYGTGITDQAQYLNFLQLYGKNNTEIPEKTTGKIFVDEILSPFYMF